MDNLIIFIPKNGRKKPLKSHVSLLFFFFFLKKIAKLPPKKTLLPSPYSPNFINGKQKTQPSWI
jgi:hypothetical protein